ncbi:putative GATA transcription factor (Ams2) [Aspergillus stella-maris]|uniref:putative GATA transcription factor (Ams2) n=1 Tax=Aspergillus stella-maris TaxID=1810926 RepID=UPI003CCD7FF7
MESQDGISVRPMRLKVLYTFDNDSKTNCLARWPHLLEIQTAVLDEKTQIGVIELKTCIQAIVCASPELVAQLGQDYTVYAYDYSEYETPLVGQGMLSWVLASASPTPNAPAHQSMTMVTGRVCKNVLGLFSKGAQETLEVKLKLVPVPTTMQSEYLQSMQKYRELSNVIPHEFDAQAWTDFVRQNPDLMTPTSQPVPLAQSPMDHSGIEKFHQILSAGSTPRDIQSMPANPPFRPTSPAQSALSTTSRVHTPRDQFHFQQQEPPASRPHHLERSQSDVIRPSSSASMRDADFQAFARCSSRRDSIQSGYGSCEESFEQQPRKRAKLYRADAPGKNDLNIERQPSSLRVAASTAASVRIHRPTPVNPLLSAAQNSTEEPVRPPTPISCANNLPRRSRPLPSLLRESSTQSNTLYTSPYPASDDHPSVEPAATSPEDSRYQGLFENSFTMPSSPPVLEYGLPTRSSPVLPPMTADLDSRFMSAGIDELLDSELGAPFDDGVKSASAITKKPKRTVRSAAQASSPASVVETPEVQIQNRPASDALQQQPSGNSHMSQEPIEKQAQKQPQIQAQNTPVSAGPTEQQQMKEAPAPPARASQSVSRPSSRPSSRAGVRPAPKPLAPAPISQVELEQLLSAIPASDPVVPSDATAATPGGQIMSEDGKPRSGAGSKRLKQVKQVQARLERCIRDGSVPPFCENCGAIETPTWRRAHSKEFDGSEEAANELGKDPLVFFWQTVDKDEKGQITRFKIYKKSLAEHDDDFALVLLCNPCGLWLHKFKSMRPEHRWNKSKDVRKRRTRNRRTGGPLSTDKGPGGRTRSDSSKPHASSPGASDASTPAADDDATPGPETDATNGLGETEQDKSDDVQEPSPKRRRANSMEPRKSSDVAGRLWQEGDAMEALRRAIQSSPARNLVNRNASAQGEKDLTPKPVRRVLFPNSQNEGGPLKALGQSVLNSPQRSSRISAAQESSKDSGAKENQAATGLDRLFESPSFGFDLCTSPTPRRRNQRVNASEKRHSLPVSPAAMTRKVAALDTTPTRHSARRLQRVQSSPGSVNRLSRTPGRSRSQFPDLPLMSDDIFGTAAFQGMDEMFVDIFSDDAIHTDPLFGLDSNNSNWADWLPSDLSPSKSDGNHDNSADIINALLSEPDLQKDMFQYPDPRTLDSGFFSSDALQADGLAMGDKTDLSATQASNPEQA